MIIKAHIDGEFVSVYLSMGEYFVRIFYEGTEPEMTPRPIFCHL